MMRALFSGVTGLRSHQTRMDVIGNNIANVNTMGYKKATVTFADLYSETLSAAAAASGTGTSATGGINAKQIGLGTTVSSITKVHSPGSAQYTGRPMDVAISGDGYFAVQTPTGIQYTRSGNFTTDTMGNLVTSSGYYVQCVAPNHTAEEEYLYNGMEVQNLVVANTKIAEPAGTIHSGTPTANLQNIIGHEFSFRYAPSSENGGFTSSTSIRYVASMPTADPTTATAGQLTGCAGTLDMGAISQAYLKKLSNTSTPPVQPTNGPGDYTVQFRHAGGSDIAMVVDGQDVSDTVTVALNTGSVPTDPVTTDLIFKDAAGENLGAITLTYPPTSTPSASDIVTLLNDPATGLKALPKVTVEENGSWQLFDNTTGTAVDEQVILTTTNQGIGTTINAGDFTLATQEYGTFRLNLSSGVASEQELSNELANSTFTLDISQNHEIEYASPGAVDANMLNGLQVDFDKYTNLTIDTKGAVIAQLLVDDTVTVGGSQVHRNTGDKVVLGYITLGTFNNPSGLETTGDNMFVVSANSGAATYATPATGNAGSLAPSNLEMSNVDLSEEMVNMIITQRGFQVNSRIITTTDTMLEELVNLKR